MWCTRIYGIISVCVGGQVSVYATGTHVNTRGQQASHLFRMWKEVRGLTVLSETYAGAPRKQHGREQTVLVQRVCPCRALVFAA